MGHYVAPDGKIYVDTAFINGCQRLPGVRVEHMGFGEFSLKTPKGDVEFDRMRGKSFEGMSGRPHAFYDTKGGDTLAKEIVKEMEAHKFSEPAPGSKMASVSEKVAARFFAAAQLHCDMEKDCKAPVSHIDNKGFIYCTKHGEQRKAGGTPCRALKPAEIKKLEAGETIRYRLASERCSGAPRCPRQSKRCTTSSRLFVPLRRCL